MFISGDIVIDNVHQRVMSEGYNDWSHDKVDDGIAKIQDMFLSVNSRGISTVFYIHCDAGKNQLSNHDDEYYDYDIHRVIAYI